MYCCKNCSERTVTCHLHCDRYKKAMCVAKITKLMHEGERHADALQIKRKMEIRRKWQKLVQRGRVN